MESNENKVFPTKFVRDLPLSDDVVVIVESSSSSHCFYSKDLRRGLRRLHATFQQALDGAFEMAAVNRIESNGIRTLAEAKKVHQEVRFEFYSKVGHISVHSWCECSEKSDGE